MEVRKPQKAKGEMIRQWLLRRGPAKWWEIALFMMIQTVFLAIMVVFFDMPIFVATICGIFFLAWLILVQIEEVQKERKRKDLH